METAINEATDGAEVQLGTDYTQSSALTISKSLTFDLNGHTLTVTGTSNEGALIASGSGVQVNYVNGTVDSKVDDVIAAKDGAVVNLGSAEGSQALAVSSTSSDLYAFAGGKINVLSTASVSSTSASYVAAFATGSDSQINVQGGSITSTSQGALSLAKAATGTLENGTLKTNAVNPKYVAVWTRDANTRFTMNGGTISAPDSAGLSVTGHSSAAIDGGLVSAGGAFAAGAYESSAAPFSTLDITGGKIVGKYSAVYAGINNQHGESSGVINVSGNAQISSTESGSATIIARNADSVVNISAKDSSAPKVENAGGGSALRALQGAHIDMKGGSAVTKSASDAATQLVSLITQPELAAADGTATVQVEGAGSQFDQTGGAVKNELAEGGVGVNTVGGAKTTISGSSTIEAASIATNDDATSSSTTISTEVTDSGRGLTLKGNLDTTLVGDGMQLTQSGNTYTVVQATDTYTITVVGGRTDSDGVKVFQYIQGGFKANLQVKDSNNAVIPKDTAGNDGRYYTVEYTGYDQVGTATAHVTIHLSDSSSVVKTVSYVIEGSSLTATFSEAWFNKEEMTKTYETVYSGLEQRVKFEGFSSYNPQTGEYAAVELTEGTDFDYSWANNTSAGTASITMTGKGNYSGTFTKNFTINQAKLADAQVKLALGGGEGTVVGNPSANTPSFTYTAKNVKSLPTLTVGLESGTDDNGQKTYNVISDSEYKVEWKHSNTNVGTSGVFTSEQASAAFETAGTITVTISPVSSNLATDSTYVFTIEVKQPVASVKASSAAEPTYYHDLAEAFKAAGNGSTITLEKDTVAADATGDVVNTKGTSESKVTLDLSGHNLGASVSNSGYMTVVGTTSSKVSAKMTNSGTLELGTSTVAYDCDIESTGGTLTISAGTFKKTIANGTGSTANISGGTFDGTENQISANGTVNITRAESSDGPKFKVSPGDPGTANVYYTKQKAPVKLDSEEYFTLKNSIKALRITASGDKKYTATNTPLKPTLTFTEKGNVENTTGGATVSLTEDTDYMVSYSPALDNTTAAGEYTVTVTGKQSSWYESGTCPYVVGAYNLSNATSDNAFVVTMPTDLYYDGTDLSADGHAETNKLTATVTLNGVDVTGQLKVEYGEKTKAGNNYVATITPAADNKNFTGSTTKTYSIAPYDVTKSGNSTFTYNFVENQNYTLQPKGADGAQPPVHPEIGAVTITIGSNTYTLTNGTDYDVTYSGDATAGTNSAKVVVTGKGNYQHATEKSYSIYSPVAQVITKVGSEIKATVNYKSLKDAITAVNADSTSGAEYSVSLLANDTIEASTPDIGKKVDVDINGKTLTAPSDGGQLVFAADGSSLTDTAATKGSVTAASGRTTAAVVAKAGLTITGVTYTDSSSGTPFASIETADKTLTLGAGNSITSAGTAISASNGTVQITDGSYKGKPALALSGSGSGSVTGGTLTGDGHDAVTVVGTAGATFGTSGASPSKTSPVVAATGHNAVNVTSTQDVAIYGGDFDGAVAVLKNSGSDKAGNLTIHDGDFDATSHVVKIEKGGNIAISGGTFDTSGSDAALYLSSTDNATSLKVSGGAFTGTNALNIAAGTYEVAANTETSADAVKFLVSGAETKMNGSVQTGTSVKNVLAGGIYKSSDNASALFPNRMYQLQRNGTMYSVVEGTPVVQETVGSETDGNKKVYSYSSIENALADGAVNLVLVADNALDKPVLIGDLNAHQQKSVSINLNGFNISQKAGLTDFPDSGNPGKQADYLVGICYNAKLTVTNEKNDSTTTAHGSSGIIDGGNLACGIKLTMKSEERHERGATVAELDLKSGTVKGKYYGISGNGNRHGTVISVGDSATTTEPTSPVAVVEGTNDLTGDTDDARLASSALGIYHPQYGVLNVYKGASISGTGNGIEIRSGLLNMVGGKVSGGRTYYYTKANGNGATTMGAGIAVAQHTTQQALALNITGGTITGARALSVANPQDNAHEYVNQAITAEGLSGLATGTVALSVSGGTFQSLGSSGSVDSTLPAVVFNDSKYPNAFGFITGGSFSRYLDYTYCPESHIPTYTAASGLYGVENKVAAAAVIVTNTKGELVDEAAYETLEAALTASQVATNSGATAIPAGLGENNNAVTVKLLGGEKSGSSPKAHDSFVAYAPSNQQALNGRKITLDLNGKQLNVNSGGIKFDTNSNGSTVTDSTVSGGAKTQIASKTHVTAIEAGADLTVEAVKFVGADDISNSNQTPFVKVSGGTLTSTADYVLSSKSTAVEVLGGVLDMPSGKVEKASGSPTDTIGIVVGKADDNAPSGTVNLGVNSSAAGQPSIAAGIGVQALGHGKATLGKLTTETDASQASEENAKGPKIEASEYAIQVKSANDEVTVNSGTYQGGSSGDVDVNLSTAATDKTLQIWGGKFMGASKNFNVDNSVTSGVFIPAKKSAEGAIVNKAEFSKNDGDKYAAAVAGTTASSEWGLMETKISDTYSPYMVGTAVARILDGNQNVKATYGKIQDAISAIAAKKTEIANLYTITMVADSIEDVTVPSVVVSNTLQAITLDLNGHTLTGASGDGDNQDAVTVNGKLIVKDSNGSNGKIIASARANGTTSNAVRVEGTPAASFELQSGTISNTAGYGIYVRDSGSVTISGGTVTSKYSAISGNNKTGPSTITVSNGTLTSSDSPAIYKPDSGILNISQESGKTTTINGGVSIRLGTVNISGGTITALASGKFSEMKDSYTYTYSGNASLPDAVYVWGGTYTNNVADGTNEVKLNITGGTIKSENGAGTAVAIYQLQKVAQPIEVKVTGGSLSTTAKKKDASGNAIEGALVDALAVYDLADLGITPSYTAIEPPAITKTTTGGTYSSVPDGLVIQDGYAVTANTGSDKETHPYTLASGRAAYVSDKADTKAAPVPFHTVKDAFDYAGKMKLATGGTALVKLDDNKAGSSTIDFSDAITVAGAPAIELNLNGETLKYTGSSSDASNKAHAISVGKVESGTATEGKLTILDGTATAEQEGAGKLTVGDSTTAKNVADAVNVVAGTFTMAGGTVENLDKAAGSRALTVGEGATANVEGGALTGYEGVLVSAPTASTNATLNVTGGEITAGFAGATASDSATGGYAIGTADTAGGTAKISVSGGTVTSLAGHALQLKAGNDTVITGGVISGAKDGIHAEAGRVTVAKNAAEGVKDPYATVKTTSTDTASASYAVFVGAGSAVEITDGRFGAPKPPADTEESSAPAYKARVFGPSGEGATQGSLTVYADKKVTGSQGGIFTDDSLGAMTNGDPTFHVVQNVRHYTGSDPATYGFTVSDEETAKLYVEDGDKKVVIENVAYETLTDALKFVYDLEQDATKGVSTGTVTLTKDVAENVVVPAGVTAKLDLNGFTLSHDSGDTNKHTVTVAKGKTDLTIVDTGSGHTVKNDRDGGAALYIEGGDNESAKAKVTIGTATEDGGRFQATTANSLCVVVGSNAELTVNSGTFQNSGKDDARANIVTANKASLATDATANAAVTLNGGFYSAKLDQQAYDGTTGTTATTNKLTLADGAGFIRVPYSFSSTAPYRYMYALAASLNGAQATWAEKNADNNDHPNKVYTGNAITDIKTADFTVKDGTFVFQSTDFEIEGFRAATTEDNAAYSANNARLSEYNKPLNAGTYVAKLQGVGDYTTSAATALFVVEPMDISKDDNKVTVAFDTTGIDDTTALTGAAWYETSNSDHTPVVKVTRTWTKTGESAGTRSTLEKGADYTVSYTAGTEGAGTVTVTGADTSTTTTTNPRVITSNYTGTKSLAKPAAEASTKIGDKLFYFEKLADAVAQAENGGTVTLLKDTAGHFTSSGSYNNPINKPLTLDLAGKKLTVDADEGIQAVTDGNLLIKSSSSKGSIESNSTDIISAKGGTITLGSTVDVTCSSSVIYAYEQGQVVIDGAGVVSNSTQYASAFVTGQGSSIAVKSGSLTGPAADKVTISAKAGATVDITGGKVVSNASSTVCAEGTGTVITVDGGTVETTVTDSKFCAAYSKGGGKVVLKSGTIKAAADSALVATGNSSVEMTGGTATGGTSGYSVLAHEGNAWAVVTGGTLTGPIGSGSENSGDNNKVTVSGNPDVTGYVVVDSSHQPNSTMEVSGGTFTYAVASKYCAEGYAPATKDGETGKYTVKASLKSLRLTDGVNPLGEEFLYNKDADAMRTANVVTVATSTVGFTPTVARVVGNDVSPQKSLGFDITGTQNDHPSWAGPVVSVRQSDGSWVQQTGENATLIKDLGTYKVSVSGAGEYSGTIDVIVTVEKPDIVSVALIDGSDVAEKNYKSLSEAVAAAAGKKAKITLLADIEESLSLDNISSDLAFDLGGHTLKGGVALRAGTYKFDNGTLVPAEGKAQAINIYGSDSPSAANYNALTVGKDLVINATYGVILRDVQGTGAESGKRVAYGTTIDIEGTINGNVWVMGNIANNTKENISKVNMKPGAVINSKGVGLALQGMAQVNVAGGSITGATACGIEVRSGELNVSGGTITGASVKTVGTANGNGTSLVGAGIGVSQHVTKQALSVSITGNPLITGGTALYEENVQGNDGVKQQLSMKVEGGTFVSTINDKSAVVADTDHFISAGSFNRQVDDKLAVESKYGAGELDDSGFYTVKPREAATMPTSGAAYDETAGAWTLGEVKTAFSGKAKQLVMTASNSAADGVEEIAISGTNWEFVDTGTKVTIGEGEAAKEYELTTSATDAGTYYAKVTPAAGSGWFYKGTNDSAAKWVSNAPELVKWTIEPLAITDVKPLKTSAVATSNNTANVGPVAADVEVYTGTESKVDPSEYELAYYRGSVADANRVTEITKSGDYKVVVSMKTGNYTLPNNKNTFDFKVSEAVAEVNGERFATLQAAFNAAVKAYTAANDGNPVTVKLVNAKTKTVGGEQVKYIEGGGAKLVESDAASIILDLDGIEYIAMKDFVGSNGTETQAFQFTKGNTVEIRDGAISTPSTGGTSGRASYLINNYADLTLKNVHLDGTNVWGGYALSNNHGNVLIGAGAKVTGPSNGCAFDVCATTNYPDGVTVTVEDGAVINGDIEYDVWTAIPADNKATLSITGGEINGAFKVDDRLTNAAKTNLSITGGTFKDGSGNTAEIKMPSGMALEKVQVSGQDKYQLRYSLAAFTPTAADKTYSGEAQAAEPTFVAKNDSDAAARVVDGDYELQYKVKDASGEFAAQAPTDAATYLVKAVGKAGSVYAGTESAEFEYVIKPIEVKSVTWTDTTREYTGAELAPTVAFADADGASIEIAADQYTIKYKKSGDDSAEDQASVKDPGTYTATLTGSANYTWPTDGMTVTFTIKAPYTVTFNAAGGSPEPAKQENVKYGDKVTKPSDMTKEGYTFLGWYQGDAAWDFDTSTVTGNTTLTAKWASTTWKLEMPYTPMGTATETGTKFAGTESSPLTLNFSPADTSIGRMSDGYWVGYKFVAPEAVTAENINKTLYTNGTKDENGDLIWKSFDTYKDSGDAFPAYMQAWVPLTVESVEALVTANKTMERTYQFAWDGDKEHYQTFVIEVDPANVVLNKDAQTDPQIKVKDGVIEDMNKNFDVTFDSDGGSDVAAQSVRYNQAASEPAAPTKAGYTFLGWYNGEDKYNFSAKVKSALTLKAKWASTTWKLETPYTPSATVTAGGATFNAFELAWHAKDSSVGRYQDGWWVGMKFIAPEAVTASTIGNALYTNGSKNASGELVWNNFSQKRDSAENEFPAWMGAWLPVSPENIEYCAEHSGSALRWTYQFAWDGNKEKVQTFVITVDPKDVTLTRDGGVEIKTVKGEVVDKNEYFDVKFDSDGGSAVDKQSVRYNAKATKPADPTKEGYAFLGWHKKTGESAVEESAYDFETGVKGATELKAVWRGDVAKVGETWYSSVNEAIAAAAKAESADNPVVLSADWAEDVVVGEGDSAGKSVKLDLNGHKLTNKAGHTITVKAGSTLEVIDASEGTAGTVDNVTNGKAALWNEGTATLSGGTFERSGESADSTPKDGKGNSYYTLVNHGTMTIGAGTAVKNAGHYSSMIENGWYKPSQNTSGAMSNLTINGGTFEGGLYNVKNDDYGVLEINGGTFKNTTSTAGNVLAWNTATIAGGTFAADNVNVVTGYAGDDTYEKASVTVTGGEFSAKEGAANVISAYPSRTSGKAKVSITGGTYSAQFADADLGGLDLTFPDASALEPSATAEGKFQVRKSIAAVDIKMQEIPEADRTYTGSQITPTPVLKLDETTLTAGTDYVVTGYGDNIDAGKGTIKVAGLGDYVGTSAEYEFAIVAQQVTPPTAVEKTYDGKEQTLFPKSAAYKITDTTETGSVATVKEDGAGALVATKAGEGTAKFELNNEASGPVNFVWSGKPDAEATSPIDNIKWEVKKAEITITPNALSMYEKATGKTLTATVTGDLYEGDSDSVEYRVHAVNGNKKAYSSEELAALAPGKYKLVAEGPETVPEANKNYAITWGELAGGLTVDQDPGDESYVAKIEGEGGTVYYKSLSAAVAQAAAASTANKAVTVTLLDNKDDDSTVVKGDGVFLGAGTANVVIDLNGLTYEVTSGLVGSPNTVNQAFHLEKGNAVRIENGTIASDCPGTLMLVQNYSNLTLRDVTLDGRKLSGSHSYVSSNNNGTISFEGSTSIMAKEGDVAFDVYNWIGQGYTEGAHVTVNTTGTITGTIEVTGDSSTTADNDVSTLRVIKGNFENVKFVDAGKKVTGKIQVEGGMFSQKVPDAWCADGFAPTEVQAGGSYTVAYAVKSMSLKFGEAEPVTYAQDGASAAALTYSGTDQAPTVTSVKAHGASSDVEIYAVAGTKSCDVTFYKVTTGENGAKTRGEAVTEIVDAGEYVAVAEASGAYAGSFEVFMTVMPQTIASVELGGASATYNGQAQPPTVTAKNASNETIAPSAYDVEYYVGDTKASEAKNAATYTVKAKPKDGNTVLRNDIGFPLYVISPKAVKPVAVTGLTYDGEAQVGVAAGEGYTVRDGSARNAGSHTAVATLESGGNYAWDSELTSESDGTVKVVWSIAKANATVTANSVTWFIGSTEPEFGATAEGLVEGDGVDGLGLTFTVTNSTGTGAGDTWKTVPGKYEIVVGQSTSSSSSSSSSSSAPQAGNYDLTCVNGKLTVRAAIKDVALKGVTYTGEGISAESVIDSVTGTDNKAMEPEGYEVLGFKADDGYVSSVTNAGEYTVVLKVKDSDVTYEKAVTIGKKPVAHPTVTSASPTVGQTVVRAGTGYTLTPGANAARDASGNIVATSVGAGGATATLDANYEWSDGAPSLSWTAESPSSGGGGGGGTAPAPTTTSISSGTLEIGPGGAYTGEAKEPAVTVRLGGSAVPATGYAVHYAANVDAGTATVVVVGRGSYSGSLAGTFEIARASIAAAEVAPIPDQARTGGAVTPALEVSLGGAALVANRDYVAAYSGNVAAGTATATVTGIGNYAGTRTAAFRIVDGPAPAEAEVYRLYNPNSGEHFYTTDAEERGFLAGIGWHDEGVGWVAPATSTVEVYRLYNPNSGDHHYTVDADERDHLVEVGWDYEHVEFYGVEGGAGVPLWRLYNPNAEVGAHHFTIDEEEYDHLAEVGWRPEGMAWRAIR